MANLRIGSSGNSVRDLQRQLASAGFNPRGVDGVYGPNTAAAVRAYQRANGLQVDGIFGNQTRNALFTDSFESGPVNNGSTTGASGTNRTATFDRVTNAGQRSQMVEGRITVNGRTYQFRSGGHGRGSLPPGSYTITPHLWNRNTPGMVVGGVGYSFAMSDKYDSRVNGTRTLLRIHPDGGSAGTQGCIGIVGDAATQRRFVEDMRAELQRSGGSFTLRVG